MFPLLETLNETQKQSNGEYENPRVRIGSFW